MISPQPLLLTEPLNEKAFLGVEYSASGRRWRERHCDERLALTLAQRHTLPDVIAKSLAARGVTLDDAPLFLAPRLRDALPDPKCLRDMEKAAERVAKAFQSQEKIAVFGDYDVDGATSAALLIRFARSAGREIRLYVPDRLTEGYGPNEEAMRTLAKEGITLLICVDCGTTAHKPLALATDLGIDTIILDHHTAETELPPVYAVVNPNRLDESGELATLAAVGVTYLFVVATNRHLRATQFFGEHRKEPDLLEWLDLVALGTICDVVKLAGLNRAFAAQGLRVMSQRKNLGIRALAATAGCKGAMDAYTAGFILGPRVNAGGRVGEAAQGARLLSTEDESLAVNIAQHLQILNDERRALEAGVLLEAEAQARNEELPMAFVAGENWHPGVIGIVASRLKERFNCPALVVALDGGIGKGSGRSIGNIDLGAAIIAARQAGLLLNGGGHKMAAGFTVAREKLNLLRDFLAERIGRQIEAEPLKPTLTLDGLLAASSLKPDFIRTLAALGPFGAGNAEPRFAFANCKIVKARIVGEKHLSIIALQGGERLSAIAFRATENGLADAFLNPGSRNFHIAGRLRMEEWQGEERIQLHIDDCAPV